MNQIYKYKLLQGYLDNTSTTPSTDPEIRNLDFSKNYFRFNIPKVTKTESFDYTTGSISISNNSILGTNLTNYYYAIGSGEPTSSTVLKWQKFNGSNINVALSTQYDMYVYFKGINGELIRDGDDDNPFFPIGTYGTLKAAAQYLNFNVTGNINNSTDKENIAKYVGIGGDYGSLIYGEDSQYYGAGVNSGYFGGIYKNEEVNTPIVSFINTAIGSCGLDLFNTVSEYPYMFAGSLISNIPKFNFTRNIDENDVTDLNTKYTTNFISDYMFADCKNIQSADTPNQPIYFNCEGMYKGCENIETANINIAMDFINDNNYYPRWLTFNNDSGILGRIDEQINDNENRTFINFLKDCNSINRVNINFSLGSVNETTKKSVFDQFFKYYYEYHILNEYDLWHESNEFNPLTKILTDLPTAPGNEPNYSYIVNVNNVFEQNKYWADWCFGRDDSYNSNNIIGISSKDFYDSLYYECKQKNWVLKLNDKIYWVPRFHTPIVPQDDTSEYIQFTLVYDTWYDNNSTANKRTETMGTFKVRKNTDWYTLIKIINGDIPAKGPEDSLINNMFFGNGNSGSYYKLKFITKISGTYYGNTMNVNLKWPGIIGFSDGILGDGKSGSTYHPYIYTTENNYPNYSPDIDGPAPVHPANLIENGKTYFIRTLNRTVFEFEDISTDRDIIDKTVKAWYTWEEVTDPEYYI